MGPTAAGKTNLAMQLQDRLPLEIVSVDSAMVYRGLDIGTAKPAAAELARAPHWLIDICDATENYSAGRFCRDALQAIETIRAGQKIPLLVGGTGLYFRSLERGFSTLPSTDKATRRRLSGLLSEWGTAGAHARLAKIDAESARRIHPNDRQRIQRALEVYEMTGKTLSDLLAAGRHPALAAMPLKFVLAPADRAVLHQAVEQRFDTMLARGLLEEVRGFYARDDMHADLSSMRLVGYRQVWGHLAGEFPYEEMRRRAIAATRQLVKRQLTWLRAEPESLWLEPASTDICDVIAKHIQSRF
ncbi:MAG: tRNA (adenosine(37)-N6)-dimethylallyltransferase MiaA [Gammaproteobacteria bacterium]